MADPLGSLEKIVKLALRIKEAVDTVRQNRDECRQIRTRAVRVSSLLSRLPETGMTADSAMCDALEDLEESLRRAHTLVAACQESTTVCIYCTARRQARRLRRVQDDISQKVMLVVFATNIQTTIILTSIMRTAEQAGGLSMVELCGPADDILARSQLVGAAHDDVDSDEEVETNDNGSADSSTILVDGVIMGRPLAPPLKPATPSTDTCIIVVDDILPLDGLRKFSLSELEAATHHFSTENMIGSGASATVYKGILQDGLVVAIKKVRNPYFRTAGHIDELHPVSKLKHKNIVKLIGYGTGVLERDRQLGDAKVGAKKDKETFYFFVEEYMPSGSLNKIINGLQLDWTTQFLLIQGIAQGLCYLHRKNVVHLDVKPSNILLDSDMYPKITDFGIATVLNCTGVDIGSHIDTIAGTLGYMPPEYITNGTLSKKHDVYGFGVTILEVISGMSRSKRASSQSSIQWAWEARQAGGMMQLLEPSLFDTPQLKEIKRCVEVGLLCTQFDPADRPDMVDALQMLRGEKALRIPVRPRYTKELTNWFGGLSCLQVRL